MQLQNILGVVANYGHVPLARFVVAPVAPEAINAYLENLRGFALGFRNFTKCRILLLEIGGCKNRPHP